MEPQKKIPSSFQTGQCNLIAESFSKINILFGNPQSIPIRENIIWMLNFSYWKYTLL